MPPSSFVPASFRRAAVVASLLAVTACSESTPTGGGDDPPLDAASDDATLDRRESEETPAVRSETVPIRPRANPSEYVAFTTELRVDASAFSAIVGPLLGLPAASGNGHTNFVLQNGLLLESRVDASAPEQLVIRVGMETATGAEPFRRTVTQVPASTAYGQLFYDTVQTAIATAARNQADRDEMETFRIEYRTRSPHGGSLVVAYDFDGSEGTLVLTASGPRTSLLPERINLPAFDGRPFETVYGRVNFSVDRDQFDFFVNRAYGISAGAAQNFRDFYLLPHDWLRLTVTPELDDERIDVAFEIVTLDGRRLPISRAPASMLAGEQFMETVFRMLQNMEDGEAGALGTGTSWQAPFYYDDPEGGGVVEVIATGRDGRMRIAYAVESPANALTDVDFVPYQGSIEVPEGWDELDPACSDLGSREAPQGFFTVRFNASSTVRRSLADRGPIRGNVWGSVYRDADVRITGPLPGSRAMASFAYANVDLGAEGSVDTYRIDTPLPAGRYQILGFLDINDNADPNDPGPDAGDPVMIPIGGFDLTCAEQPITAEFAILLPAGR